MKKDDVHQLLQNLEPISLSGLDDVKLLNRVDTKYVIPINGLPGILNLLSTDYSILEIDGARAFTYETTYFDTADYLFYKDHHNNMPNRMKVRTRTYKESNLHFFEIKMKINLRTNKIRQKLREPGTELTEKQNQKIKTLYPRELENPLIPILINSYTRITLVNKARTERSTIDLNLSYRNPEAPEKEINVHDIAIIEVKQSKTSLLQGIIASLRGRQIYSSSISKYVLGLILTRPEIKQNEFKPLLLKINKIKQQLNPFINNKTQSHEKTTYSSTGIFAS